MVSMTETICKAAEKHEEVCIREHVQDYIMSSDKGTDGKTFPLSTLLLPVFKETPPQRHDYTFSPIVHSGI